MYTFRFFQNGVKLLIKVAFLSALCASGRLTFADEIETKIRACNWEIYPNVIEKFREHRRLLPDAIKVTVQSCESGGPTYQVQTKRKVVVIQDGWMEQPEKSNVHLLSKVQPNSRLWQLEYQGWEWNGYLWIDKETGAKAMSPGNDCGKIRFSPDRRSGVIVCSRQYAAPMADIFLISFSPAVKFKRLQKNVPEGEIEVDWRAKGQIEVVFRASQSRPPAVRRYRI
jgi:hypothetical protein